MESPRSPIQSPVPPTPRAPAVPTPREPVPPSEKGRYVISFYTNSNFPEQGIIAALGTAFLVPQRVPHSGRLKRFYTQFPAGCAFRVTVRLLHQQKVILPVPGKGYIILDDAIYDNRHVDYPVKAGDYLYVEVQNFSAFQQELSVLCEIEPEVSLYG